MCISRSELWTSLSVCLMTWASSMPTLKISRARLQPIWVKCSKTSATSCKKTCWPTTVSRHIWPNNIRSFVHQSFTTKTNKTQLWLARGNQNDPKALNTHTPQKKRWCQWPFCISCCNDWSKCPCCVSLSLSLLTKVYMIPHLWSMPLRHDRTHPHTSMQTHNSTKHTQSNVNSLTIVSLVFAAF